MQNEDVGEHPSAGQSCPAAAHDPHSASPEGCDNVRVLQVPLEKLAAIEKILGGSKHFASGTKAGVKLAGLFIIAACVSGELSPEPHAGQSIHAHGGHENKRTVVRRPVVRKKFDGADPEPLANDEDGRSKLEDGMMGCKNRVDLCENRTDDGVCLMQDRPCRWVDRDHEMLSVIDRKISAVQKEVGELRRAKMESPADTAASDDEARRLFALLKALETESYYRKAPVTRVFQLYCLEGLTRDKVAKKCRCAPSLVTLRLRAIESKLGRKASALRQISDHFDRIAASLSDDRARHIHRPNALDDPGDDDEDAV
jgi:hypothetical protein